MSDSLIHLQSAGADVVIKTRPFAEIVYWGPHLSHFFTAGCRQPDAPGRQRQTGCRFASDLNGGAGPWPVWRAGH